MNPSLHDDLVEISPGRRLHLIYINHDSANTIFFLHGAGGRVDQWRNQIQYFKNKECNLVAFDYLGHGKSEKPEPTKSRNLYSFSEIYADIQAIFNQYKTANNFIVAHSYGGAFASYLCLHNPQTIAKMVLISPTDLKPKPFIAKAFFLPLPVLELMKRLLELGFIKLAFHPHTDPELIQYEMSVSRQNPMYVLKPLILDMRNIPFVDICPIAQPTLVIMGERDLLIPSTSIYSFYRQLSHVEFITIKNAAHLSILEQPQQVNHLLDTFLLSH